MRVEDKIFVIQSENPKNEGNQKYAYFLCFVSTLSMLIRIGKNWSYLAIPLT